MRLFVLRFNLQHCSVDHRLYLEFFFGFFETFKYELLLFGNKGLRLALSSFLFSGDTMVCMQRLGRDEPLQKKVFIYRVKILSPKGCFSSLMSLRPPNRVSGAYCTT
jgi:hypothetical protein